MKPTKTAEAIEMPFKWVTPVDPGNCVLDRGSDPLRKGAFVGGIALPFD